jgi:large subunit ribosomal protein L3
MLKTILGSKQTMSQAFIKGRRVPVTQISAGPCIVTYIKNLKKDGYWAIQLGYGKKNIKNISKSIQGHLKTIIKEKSAPNFLAEVRFSSEPKKHDGSLFKVGDIIRVSEILKKGDLISITGISKGKGFAGVVKRWHFAGGPKTHGQSDRQRAPGAISGGTTPGRVRKGKKMAGRMGNEQKTIKNLQVEEVYPDKDLIEIIGPVPGIPGGNIVIKKIKEGKLEGITEVQAQVVEGEPEAEVKEENKGTEKVENKEDIKNA